MFGQGWDPMAGFQPFTLKAGLEWNPMVFQHRKAGEGTRVTHLE